MLPFSVSSLCSLSVLSPRWFDQTNQSYPHALNTSHYLGHLKFFVVMHKIICFSRFMAVPWRGLGKSTSYCDPYCWESLKNIALNIQNLVVEGLQLSYRGSRFWKKGWASKVVSWRQVLHQGSRRELNFFEQYWVYWRSEVEVWGERKERRCQISNKDG